MRAYSLFLLKIILEKNMEFLLDIKITSNVLIKIGVFIHGNATMAEIKGSLLLKSMIEDWLVKVMGILSISIITLIINNYILF